MPKLNSKQRRYQYRLLWTALVLVMPFAQAMGAGILPEGAQVTAGSASMTQTDNHLLITQGSDRLITQWQSFDIGSDARVDFLQPNADSVALNRVVGGDPSQILGSLNANGRVFLLNPSGIIFGANAQVNVGGLVATTLDLSDEDFLKGLYVFSNGGHAGNILNQGRIDGKVVALLAPQVRNEGSIHSPQGTAILAAGDGVSLDFVGDGLLNVTVNRGAYSALAENQGLIQADGGKVVMSARAAGDLMGSVINNQGIIEAKGLVQRDGQIVLDGGDQGVTSVSGTLDASSVQHGGKIVVTGDKVLVNGDAKLLARGDQGGGDILVGGGWQGSDPEIHAAQATVVQAGAVLDASAGTYGKGGTVVAWSDVQRSDSITRAYGTFLARGGLSGGDGGRIETSGHHLDVQGIQLASDAPYGKNGSWLIDPSDITISSAGSGSLTGGVFDPTGASDTISPATILTGLASGDVTIQTSGGTGGNGDITVANAITTSTDLGGVRTLTLKADRDIIFNSGANIDATGGTNSSKLNIVLNSDTNGDGVGGISMVGTTLASKGGNINLGGGTVGTGTGYTGGLATIAHYAPTSGTAANIGISIGGGSTIDAGGGNITLHGQGLQGDGSSLAKGVEFMPDNTLTGSIALQTIGTGSISINGLGDSTATGNFNYGVDFHNVSSSLSGINLSTQSGSIAITGAGGGTGSSANNSGVLFQGDNITVASTAGSIAITGTTGSTSGNGISLSGNNLVGGGSTTGNITLTGDSMALTGGTLQTSTTLNLDASSAATITEGASTVLSADKLLFAGAGATFNFTAGSNTVTTLAANTGSIDYLDTDGLDIATVGATNGITASGTVSVATASGDLSVSKNIFSADTGASSVVLNAGKNTAAGTASGGNIIINGAPSITTGAGGRATFYSGSIASSTGLTTLIGSGSGNFRYDSDEIFTPPSMTALGAGKYALYREQPTVTITADNQILSYGTAPTLSSTITGLKNGDTASQAFSTAATVGVSGSTSGSGNYIVGSHTLTPASAVSGLGYNISYASGTLTVNKRDITVTYSGVDKVYDGNTSASINITDDRETGDAISINHSEAFRDKNVGAGKTIDITGISLSGTDAANYNINATATTTASITARTLNVTYTGNNKVYDGTTAATVNASDDRVAGDFLAVNSTATFSPDENVGIGKTINITGVTLSGTDAANYSVSATGTTTANITPRTLNVTYTGVNREYDGTTVATVTTSDDRVAGDLIDISRTATFAPDKNAGTGKTVNISGVSLTGTDAGNYTVAATGTTTADILPKLLTLSATVADKVYDGTTAATVTSFGSSGFVGSETINASYSGAAFDTKNVGIGKTVTISGIALADGTNGGLASNYTVGGTTTNTTASITPRTLNVTYSGVDKVYDGTVAASVTTTDDRVAGDSLTIGRSAGFDTKQVGTGKVVAVSGVALTGTDASNYTVAATGATTAAITPKDLTATYSASSKVYDGTTDADVSGSSTDVINGDEVTFSQNAAFIDKNAGTGKTVNVSAVTLGGADAGNYNLLDATTTATADITPKQLTIDAVVEDKVYDGNTTATVLDFPMSGFVGSETVTAIASSANFNTRYVGAAKPVAITGITLLDGSNGGLAANYTVPTDISSAANITPNPYAINVTSSITSPAIGNNSTSRTTFGDGSLLAVSGQDIGPGSGGSVIITAGRDILRDASPTRPLTSGFSMIMADTATPISFSTVGSTMTLSLGTLRDNLEWPITRRVPVYQWHDGDLFNLATYNVVDTGASLSMVKGFTDQFSPKLRGAEGPAVDLSLSLKGDVSSKMSVSLTTSGDLLIRMKSHSILDQDMRTAVLLGLAAAKQQLGTDLYDINSVVIRK